MSDNYGNPISNGGRIPPQSVDTEKAILGACILEREPFWIASDFLTADDFYASKHRKVWTAIAQLSAENITPDLITVSERLKKAGDLSDVGGSHYLTELTSSVASTSNVEHYARIVKEKAMLRRGIEAATALASEAYDPAADAFEVIEKFEQSVMGLQPELRKATALPDILKQSLVDLENIHGSERGVTGIPSGIRQLDEMTTGWQKSDLTVVAARPSMGKTAFACKLITSAAQQGVPAAVYTMEMTAGQLAMRLLYAEARVDAQRARQGRLSDDDWPRLARAAGKLAQLPITIDDTPSLSITQLRSKLRRLKIEGNCGFAVVDYLQLMTANLGRQSNRENEIAHISRGMKGLAKELDIPIILLSQLSREPERRGGMKRPILSDLRESGSIEQDCDNVIFIYRAERYDIRQDEDGNSTEGVAELIVSKQRQGPIGTVIAGFVKDYVTFENFQYSPSVTGRPPDDYTQPRRAGMDDAPF